MAEKGGSNLENLLKKKKEKKKKPGNLNQSRQRIGQHRFIRENPLKPDSVLIERTNGTSQEEGCHGRPYWNLRNDYVAMANYEFPVLCVSSANSEPLIKKK